MEFTGDRILTAKMAEGGDMDAVLPAGPQFSAVMKHDGKQWVVETNGKETAVGGTEVNLPKETTKTYNVRVLPYRDGTVDVLAVQPLEV